MDVMAGGRRLRLEASDVIGVGGEATVYGVGDEAVKVYHQAMRAHQPVGMDQLRALRRGKLEEFPRGLPEEIIGPRALVRSIPAGDLVGYTMRRLSRVEDFRRLAQRSWREGRMSNEVLMKLFERLRRLLAQLHARGVVVGDLNDGNVVFRGAEVYVIDADSMQFGRYPCVMAHERFVAPELFGVDLTARPWYTPATDWYAFAVLLFSSLLYVHPYGGVHPVYGTLLQRVEARHSILRPDVKVPKRALSPDILPAPLLDYFRRVFDGGERGAPDPALLRWSWSRCRCGIEHGRDRCPGCSGRPVAAPTRRSAPPLRSRGRCRAKTVARPAGRLLAVAWQDRLRFLVERRGELVREDGRVVATGGLDEGTVVGLRGAATCLARGRLLIELSEGEPPRRAACGRFMGRPAFAASSRCLVTVVDGQLVDARTQLRYGTAIDGITYLAMGERVGVGLYAVGALCRAFFFLPGRAGLRHVEIPALEGHLVDQWAQITGDRVLLELLVKQPGGRRRHHLFVISGAGTVLAHESGGPESGPFFRRLGAKALAGGRLFCATDDGLLSFDLDCRAGALQEGYLVVETEPFLREDADLVPAPGGAIYASTPRALTQLTLT